MKLIVGLGNPGGEYANTRHNAGFMALDHFVESNPQKVITHWEDNMQAHTEILAAKINSEKIILAKPFTYMNRSGHAIASLMSKYKLNNEDLIIVHDDFDLDLGSVRVRNSGSSGGHNGVKSIINILKTEEFVRVRLGVGNRNDSYFTDKKIPREDYVLLPFLQLERPQVNDMLDKAAEYITLLVQEGYPLFISKHHRD